MKKKYLSNFICTIIIAANLILLPSKAYAETATTNMTRLQVQDRAYRMAYTPWHYIKSRNGNVQFSTELPNQLKTKTDSYEKGIPYNWGAFDGLDTSSSRDWGSFYDAMDKGAMAGNIYCEGGYKANTAGIDCSGFVQSSLNLRGWKQSTWTLGNYMTPISYDELKNMDVLLWKTTHVAFFQSWVYDEYGNKLGANTLEATCGNYDGAGQKVKEYYRSINELTKNYVPQRYNYISNDFIENNSGQPYVESPLFRQAIYKSSNKLLFKWGFKDVVGNGYQTAYRIRIYSGEITQASNVSGKFVYEISENTNISEKALDLSNMPVGKYYFVLETRNNRGYWSNPLTGPFQIVEDSAEINTKFNSISRYGGQNRFETSKIIAENTFPSKVNSVILASGSNFPDGLAGVTLSKEVNGPILLVDKNAASSGSSYALQYIANSLDKSGKIYILGGEGVIDSSFLTYLKKLGYSESNIIRLCGKDRNETSVKIAESLNLPEGNTVILSSDGGFADSLSISPIAGFNKWPILLTSATNLNVDVEQYLQAQKPSKIFIVGGTGVISDNVKNRVKQITGLDDSNIIRLCGKDRYDTNVAINSYFYNSPVSKVYAAYGETFPDSLSGSASAAIDNAPLVLVSDYHTTSSASSINTVSSSNKIDLSILGGIGVISNYQVSKIENLSITLSK